MDPMGTPLKNDGVKVSWDDYKMFQTTNQFLTTDKKFG